MGRAFSFGRMSGATRHGEVQRLQKLQAARRMGGAPVYGAGPAQKIQSFQALGRFLRLRRWRRIRAAISEGAGKVDQLPPCQRLSLWLQTQPEEQAIYRIATRLFRGLHRPGKCVVHHPRSRCPEDQEQRPHAMSRAPTKTRSLSLRTLPRSLESAAQPCDARVVRRILLSS